MSMHVQKLSATKQRSSLGEVKKAEKAKASAHRKVIRTTVINPIDFDWPTLSENDEQQLKETLSLHLQCLKFPNYHIPLEEVKKVSKEGRREFRNIYFTQKALEVGFDVANYTKMRSDLSLGVNCVSSALEQNLLIAMIIESEVEPAILTKLLVPVAKSKNVPIIAIKGFKAICQTAFHIRCLAMGFKGNCRNLGHPFSPIINTMNILLKLEQPETDSKRVTLEFGVHNQVVYVDGAMKTSESSSVGEVHSVHRPNQGPRPSTSGTSSMFKSPKIRKV